MINKQLTIKDLPLEERPREKLIKYGPGVLTNAELLAIILRNGTKRGNVLELSKNLLKENNLRSLSRKRINALMRIFGIGQSKACQIVSCFELGRRLASFKYTRNNSINNVRDVVKLYSPDMSCLKKEHFKSIFLDSRKRIIKEETIFIGSLNASIIHPREIFQAAFEEGAAAIILLHNHPSGDPKPSDDDIEITEQLAKAGEILGIEVIDHLIIGHNKYFSFKEKDYL